MVRSPDLVRALFSITLKHEKGILLDSDVEVVNSELEPDKMVIHVYHRASNRR